MLTLEASTLSTVLSSLQDKYGADLFQQAVALLKSPNQPKGRTKRCPKPKTILGKIKSVVRVGEYLTTRGVTDRLTKFGFNELQRSVSAALSCACTNKEGFTRTQNRWYRTR